MGSLKRECCDSSMSRSVTLTSQLGPGTGALPVDSRNQKGPEPGHSSVSYTVTHNIKQILIHNVSSLTLPVTVICLSITIVIYYCTMLTVFIIFVLFYSMPMFIVMDLSHSPNPCMQSTWPIIYSD